MKAQSVARPLFFLLYSFFFSVSVNAQRSEILVPNVATLQVVAGDEWLSMPVIGLRGDAPVNISFDELSHAYHRYTYNIRHCEADWTPSEELIESDYVDGFASDNPIEDYAQSINTNTLYTHYRLQIPNDRCRLKLGGNYIVTVYDDDSGDIPVLRACFMVTEETMKARLQISGNTDVDVNKSHQQVAVSLNFTGARVTRPEEQIKTVVMQNGRWDNAVVNSKPQYVRADGLAWDHDAEYVFPAGNEYRKFETLDPTHTTMGLERVGWDGKKYHAWVFTDEPRPSYVYDEDANGAFYIRNSDNVENETTCDYILVHFRLRSPRTDRDIYLNGVWTQDRFLQQYKMQWSEADNLYEAVVPLKQGYYSYQYLVMEADGAMRPLPSEGSFYQTENKYQVLVYYRGQGERTDRLVAFDEATIK